MLQLIRNQSAPVSHTRFVISEIYELLLWKHWPPQKDFYIELQITHCRWISDVWWTIASWWWRLSHETHQSSTLKERIVNNTNGNTLILNIQFVFLTNFFCENTGCPKYLHDSLSGSGSGGKILSKLVGYYVCTQFVHFDNSTQRQTLQLLQVSAQWAIL
mgnify:CR=1 FL=1